MYSLFITRGVFLGVKWFNTYQSNPNTSICVACSAIANNAIRDALQAATKNKLFTQICINTNTGEEHINNHYNTKGLAYYMVEWLKKYLSITLYRKLRCAWRLAAYV